jgi:hypothetical protein
VEYDSCQLNYGSPSPALPACPTSPPPLFSDLCPTSFFNEQSDVGLLVEDIVIFVATIVVASILYGIWKARGNSLKGNDAQIFSVPVGVQLVASNSSRTPYEPNPPIASAYYETPSAPHGSDCDGDLPQFIRDQLINQGGNRYGPTDLEATFAPSYDTVHKREN